MKKVRVITVTCNNIRTIYKVYEGLEVLKKLEKYDLSLTVIDNNSKDGTTDFLKKKLSFDHPDFPDVIFNRSNRGFAAAANQGIKKALQKKTDYILLLNPDTFIISDFISPLILSESDIVSPIIEFQRNGKTIYDLGGKINQFIGRTYHLESVKHSTFNIQHLPSVDFVSACCMLVKSRVFKKIGLFDERFFLYFEDADFCLRAKKAGLGITVCRSSRLFHKLIDGKSKPFKIQMTMLYGNLAFILKNTGIFAPLGIFYVLLLFIKTLACSIWKE